MNHAHRPITPAEAALYGLAAGLASTVLMSAVSRLPGIRERSERTTEADRAAARAEESDVLVPMSPAMALVQASGPGPEGPAGLFAAKVASGLFGRDLGKQTQAWGRAVHLAYGSLWGVLYGMFQTRRDRAPIVSGASHGLAVWAAGPGLLLPAMKLMPAPSRAPRLQAAIGVAAHVAYGVGVAAIFHRMIRTAPSSDPPSA